MHTVLILATLLSQAPAPAAPARLDLQLHGARSAATGEALRLDTSESSHFAVEPGVRIPTMALGGLLLGAAAAAGGVAVPLLLEMPSTGDLGPFAAMLTGGGLGALLGTSVGVWGTSRLMGGQGSYTGSLLGTAAGIGAGVGLLFVASATRDHTMTNVSLWTAAALPVVGAVVGSEWSAPPVSESFQVMPSLALSPNGAQAGLSGHF